MIAKRYRRPFKYPVRNEYAALGLDPTKIEALYLFDSAENLHDASGKERHGDISTSSGFSGTGRSGQGMYFDQVDDIVVLDAADMSFGDGTTDSPFSVSAWVNVDSTHDVATTSVIIAKSTVADGEWRFLTRREAAGEITFRLVILDDSAAVSANSVSSLSFAVDDWHKITATYDPSVGSGATAANGIELYLDDVQDGSPTRTNNAGYVAMESLAGLPSIGDRDIPAVIPYKGIIDLVSVHSEVLNISQIQNLFNAGL